MSTEDASPVSPEDARSLGVDGHEDDNGRDDGRGDDGHDRNGGDDGHGDDGHDRDGGDDEWDGLRDLVRGALTKTEPTTPDVLEGVQRKIRQRSRGRFYADRWSTAREPPIATYLVTSLVMLAILLATWAVLSPLRGEAAAVEEPAPVNVVPSPVQR